ncbi:MAG TPA: DUF5615 family PIN-like protein, partial [Candidatus Methanomethylicus sp.]|nr:DUF5615 family PIN-like protein [Candidatus Methanomethylicus sp.]
MMRFLADAMLGKLVRWLRILGCDTSYLPELQDSALLELAVADGRTLLTRDVGLHRAAIRRGIPSILVKSHSIRGQLAELSPPVSLSIYESRCPLCNGALDAVARADLSAPIQPIPSKGALWRCIGCGKLYWNG